MKTNLHSLLLTTTLLTALQISPAPGLAQGPEAISYQGRVTVSGTNFSGTGQFKFALVDAGQPVPVQKAGASRTITIGVITSVVVTNGGMGYLSAPSVRAVDPLRQGSGASLLAQVSGGQVTAVTINNGGANYSMFTYIDIAAPPDRTDYQTYWSHDGTSTQGAAPTSAVEIPVAEGLFNVFLGDSSLTNMNPLPSHIFTNADARLRVWFNDGIQGFAQLSPDQPLGAVGYAMLAARVAEGGNFSAGTISAAGFSGGGSGLTNLNASQLASGTVPASALSNAWKTSGNAGTTAGTHYLGTADSQALELRVNGARAFRLEPATTPNVIGGHVNNSVAAGIYGATVAGGGSSPKPNSVTVAYGTVGGGWGNTSGADSAVIGGGRDNSIQANSWYATIAGGVGNTIATNIRYGAIGGGSANNIGTDSWNTTIAGGDGNGLGTNTDYSTIGGGYSNTITYNATAAVIAGGNRNTIGADADYGSIGGGSGNQARGLYATVPGGRENDAYGDYSFAAGRRAQAWGAGSFVWADSGSVPFTAWTTNSNVFYVRATGGAKFYTGTNAFWTEADMSCATLTIRGGADLAEPFAMSDDVVQPGAVVVIDPDRPGRLKLSTSAYDHKVAGIVSGAGGVQPGISMIQTEKLEGGRNVALSGRVFALVDATKNPVRPGDLLTTSDTPGHAMRAANLALAQGAILGKAMTPLSEGRGLVLVLVSLQ